MNTSIAILIAICVTTVIAFEKTLSDKFVDEINRAQTSWKAGKNFGRAKAIIESISFPKKNFENPLKLPEKVPEIVDDLPEYFDARDEWPECESIGQVKDQGACSSGWALAAVSAMSDRICIHSNGTKKVSLSAKHATSCVTEGYSSDCNGGIAYPVWYYWKAWGFVTGGNYNSTGSTSGCQKYPVAPCVHTALPLCGKPVEKFPKCNLTCDEGSSIVFNEDLHFGKEIYSIYKNDQARRTEIYKNGPVEAGLDVYMDFVTYKTGVYKHVAGDNMGRHHVKIIGWGVEKGEPYWLAVNSWNTDWGDNGLFKILRGREECGIDGDFLGGIPKLD